MFYISYRLSLYKLTRVIKKEHDKYVDEIKRINSDPGIEDKEQKRHYAYMDYEAVIDDIPILMTKYLLSKTQGLVIPIPPKPSYSEQNEGIFENEYWRLSQYEGEWYLTTKGLYEINKLIREERKERRDNITFWSSIIIGLIGSLIGLLSVIKDWK